VRELLKKYLELRISFYEISDWRSDAAHQLADINHRTQELQLQMWSLVQHSAGGGTATTGTRDRRNE
jgi:hypothetical protein